MWTFIQDQILDMRWLNALIGRLLTAVVLEVNTRIGWRVPFFLWRIQDNSAALCSDVSDLLYPEFFSTVAQPKDHGQVSWGWCEHSRSFVGHGNTFLHLLFHSNSHGFYKHRTSIRDDIFIFHFITNGGFEKSRSSNQYLWREAYRRLCGAGSCHCGSWWDTDGKSANGRSDCSFYRNNNSKVDIRFPNLTVKDRLLYSKDQVVSTFKKVFLYILSAWLLEQWSIIDSWGKGGDRSRKQ